VYPGFSLVIPLIVFLTGCAAPALYNAEGFFRRRDDSPFCQGEKAVRRLSVDFLLSTAIPTGIPLSDISSSVSENQTWMSYWTENVIERMAGSRAYFSERAVSENSTRKLTMWITGFLTFGVAPLAMSNEQGSGYEQEVAFSEDDGASRLPANSSRLEALCLKDDPFRFVLCRGAACSGKFKTPWGTASRCSLLMEAKTPVTFYQSAIGRSGFDLNYFLTSSYFVVPDREIPMLCGGSTECAATLRSSDLGRRATYLSTVALKRGTKIETDLEKGWIKKHVEFDPSLLCRYRRPADELFSR
jgi:hypothetical protein